ncbi:MAG: hypothetical protein JNK04_25400 [Myxococcales bacterium]|nr:hypothetical protein [Myxococcales bacterium]
MKHISPQLGFNNNVRHRGRVFHIQTEDSGIKHPHIITHLFADGGRILKTQKVSYAEFLGEEELAKKVRSLMQEQHKAMFMALRGGKFDQLLGDLLEPAKEGEPAKEAAKEAEAPAAAPPPEPRAAMGSLSGATDFAQAATTTGENAVVVLSPAERAAAVGRAMTEPAFSATEVREASPPSNKAPPPPSSQPGSNARLAALAAMDEAPPPRSRLTPPPPRAGDGAAQSPLRALASRAPVIDPTGRSGSMPGVGAPRVGARPPMSSSPGSVPPPPLKPGAPPPQRPASIRPGAPATPPAAGNPLAISASLDLDLEALERAAEQSQTPVYKQIRDLPPPPATLLRPSPPRNTSYRSVTPQATSIVADGRNHGDHPPTNDRPERAPTPSVGQRPAAGSRPGVPPQPSSSRGVVGGGRYAPSRPASIFGASRPAEGSSIFGEDLISEKSLDEVILSYLAEDLEGAGKK